MLVCALFARIAESNVALLLASVEVLDFRQTGLEFSRGAFAENRTRIDSDIACTIAVHLADLLALVPALDFVTDDFCRLGGTAPAINKPARAANWVAPHVVDLDATLRAKPAHRVISTTADSVLQGSVTVAS